MEQFEGFPPISDDKATILIVGSMPSVTSIERGEYYGHPTNDFWPIISSIYNVEFTTYQDKVDALNEHHIALWDVLASCEREKSKDNSIKNGRIHDFPHFFREHPYIGKIVANGKVAYNQLLLIKKDIDKIPFYYAPSTSKAYPLAFSQKVALWTALLS
jgi:hypoxanthine-DNA glycosylase